jgi:hypothetical protein
MKMNWKLALVLAIAGIGMQSPQVSAEDVELPLRKAGKWELKTVMAEGGQDPREQVLTMCIDAEMERNTATASKLDHQRNCSKYEIKKTADAIVVDAVCNMNGRDVSSHTTMSGDFQNAFAVKIESTTSGVNGTQSVSIKRSIEQDGKFLGDSCGDLQAGEAMSPDGVRVMVQ